jgi:hypothetical protein
MSFMKRILQNFDQPKNLQMKMGLDLKCGQRNHTAFYREKIINCRVGNQLSH